MRKPGDALLQTLKNDPRVIRFKELEERIGRHPTLHQAYENVKVAQQKYVRAKAHKSKDEDALKAIYEKAKAEVMNAPMMSEYLDLIEDLNQDLQWMIQEIEATLNQDLKEE
jgi:cell fate (sporulation/competence/biofilm development) regulator YmcA (YheA/YmcA/DUF963 family)